MVTQQDDDLALSSDGLSPGGGEAAVAFRPITAPLVRKAPPCRRVNG